MINYKRVRNEYIKDKFVTEDYYFLSYIIKHMATEAVERVVKETGIKVKVREDIRCSPLHIGIILHKRSLAMEINSFG